MITKREIEKLIEYAVNWYNSDPDNKDSPTTAKDILLTIHCKNLDDIEELDVVEINENSILLAERTQEGIYCDHKLIALDEIISIEFGA